MDYDEVSFDIWTEKIPLWPILSCDDFSSAFKYARYSKLMQKKTGFGMKDCLTLFSLSWKLFIDEIENSKAEKRNDSYTDKKIRWIFQAIKSGKVGAFYQLSNHL